MRLTRYFLAAVLAILAQLLFASAAHAKWIRGESRHFIIYTSGSTKDLQRFGADLERFDQLLRLNLGVAVDGNPNKLVIYFFPTQKEVAELAGDKTGFVGGFYSPRQDGSFAVVNRESAEHQFDLDAMGILFHEYSHHFMFRHLTNAYPAWYVEGFAEFLSTIEFNDKGNWTLGKPANHRAYSLFASRPLPIEKLLVGNGEGLDKEERSTFYARAWLLVHMLTMSPEYRGTVSRYLAQIDAGKSDHDAAIEAFGNLEELDQALDRYAKGKLRYTTSTSPIEADLAMAITTLDPIGEQLMLAELARKRGRVDETAVARLRTLAEANPDNAQAWYELALYENFLAEQGDEARRSAGEARAELAVDRALAANPNHVRANVIKAAITFEKLLQANDRNPVHWENGRKYLLVANAQAADDPLVLITWYNSFGMQGKPPSKVARAALARAFELQPEVVGTRVKYAYDLADQGRYDEAIRLVEFLAHDPHLAERGRQLIEELKQRRDAAKTGGVKQ